MNFFEIFLIAIALGMDAFSVAICKGLTMVKVEWKKALMVASFFGIFQAIMPMIGYFLGKNFESLIVQIDHWIAFVLLTGIGINLLKESWKSEDEQEDDRFDWKTLTILAIATSIDALAIGITFSFLQVQIIEAVSIIGVVAFGMSFFGVAIGCKVGDRLNQKAKIVGGVILIGMGIKILLEHLFF